jgi:hypothetical protein
MEIYPDLVDIGYEIELEAAGEAVVTVKREPAGGRVVQAEEVDLLQEIMEKEPGLKESLERCSYKTSQDKTSQDKTTQYKRSQL